MVQLLRSKQERRPNNRSVILLFNFITAQCLPELLDRCKAFTAIECQGPLDRLGNWLWYRGGQLIYRLKWIGILAAYLCQAVKRINGHNAGQQRIEGQAQTIDIRTRTGSP